MTWIWVSYIEPFQRYCTCSLPSVHVLYLNPVYCSRGSSYIHDNILTGQRKWNNSKSYVRSTIPGCSGDSIQCRYKEFFVTSVGDRCFRPFVIKIVLISLRYSPQQRARGLQQPLHRGREEDEGKGDPQQGEEHAKQLAGLSQGSHVAVAWKKTCS